MLPLVPLVLAAALVSASKPDQASNFPISPEVAAQYGCGEACHKYLNESNLKDLKDFDTPFDFEFYSTAKNFSSSNPGDVLKVVPVDPELLQVPGGVTIYKIQYTSVDLDNKTTVPATGFVAFPYSWQSDPFKLVAFAHGTSGVFRGCAPSTSSSLYDYYSWIPLLFAGYAVVGTDYVGLGNNYTDHKYIATSANANDVFWSVVAAKKAFPSGLTKEWVSIGHSQGGGASWKVSEREVTQTEESGYLGGVAIAPITHIYDAVIASLEIFKDLSAEDLQSQGSAAYLPSLYFALRAVYPNYTAPFLTDKVKKRFQLGEIAQLCAAALPGVIQDLNQSQIIGNFAPAAFSAIKEFQGLNTPADGDKTSKPLLVIAGANDTTIFPEMVYKAYKKSCKAGNFVHLSIYPELEHSAVIGASAPEWLGFINKLFHGGGLSNCSKETKDPFDARHAKKPLESEL